MSYTQPSGGLLSSRTQSHQMAAVNSDEVVVPPVLYLPVRELLEGGLIAEVHETTDRRHALFVFTALDRLLNACGRDQPWKLVETVALDEIQQTQPFDIVAFDPEIPQEMLADGKIA